MKQFFIFCLFTVSLYGTSLTSSYKITFGIFGKLGNALTSLHRSEDDYYIRMEAKATGLAKVLSNGREEIYESKGKIINNLLQPYEYKKTKINNSYQKIKKYTLDHKNKKVYLEKVEHYNLDNRTVKEQEEYKYYATNDILTLYFNILHLIKVSDEKKMLFHAIGGKEENGQIDVIKLDGEEKEKIKKLLAVSDSDIVLKVIINQKIFSSQNGELYLGINSENICSSALLKDVILFGDIKGIKD